MNIPGEGSPRLQTHENARARRAGGVDLSDLSEIQAQVAGMEPGDIFGSDCPEAPEMQELLTHGLSTLGTHESASAPDSAQVPLGTHETVEQPLDEGAPLGTHREGAQAPGQPYELGDEKILGVPSVTFKLMMSDALQNTKDNPGLYKFFQGLSLLVLAFQRGKEFKEDIEWVKAGGYTERERAEIADAQIERTKKNWDILVDAMNRGMSVTQFQSFAMDKTGGIVIVSEGVAGNPLRRLDRLIKARDHCLEGDRETYIGEMMKQRYGYEGSGMHGISQSLNRIATASYLKKHPVVSESVKGEDGKPKVEYRPKPTHGADDAEVVARTVAACVLNGIQDANAIEKYFEKNFPRNFKEVAHEAIQRAVAEEFVVEPYVANISSNMETKQVLAEELKASRFNMPAEDQDSPKKIIEHLTNRGIFFDVKSRRADGGVGRITEKELDDFISESIAEGKLEEYEPEYDSKMSPQKILGEEFRAAQFNMPEKERRSASKVMSYLEARISHGVKATRAGGMVDNIGEKDLYDFIEKLIEQDELAPFSPTYNSRMSPGEILEEELKGAWFNMPKSDRFSTEAVMQYLVKKRNIYDVKAKRTGENEAKKITEEEVNNFIHKSIREHRLNPYKPHYESGKSIEEILAEECANARLYIPAEEKRSARALIVYLKVFRDLSDVMATVPGKNARNITEMDIYAYINKLIKDGQLDRLRGYDENTHIYEILEEELIAYWLEKPENASKDYETVYAFREHLIRKRDILNVSGMKEEGGVPEKILQAELDEFLENLIKHGVMPAGRAPAVPSGAPVLPGAMPQQQAAVPNVGPQPPQPGVGPTVGGNVAGRAGVMAELQAEWDEYIRRNQHGTEEAFRLASGASDEDLDAFFGH